MKPIPIKIQIITMFLPGINLMIWFMWYYNDFCLKFPEKEVFKSMLIAALCLFAVLKVCKFIMATYTPLNVFIGYYLAPMAAGYVLIKQQQKLGVQ